MNKSVLTGLLLLFSFSSIAQSESIPIQIKEGKALQYNHPSFILQMPILPDLQQPIFSENNFATTFKKYMPLQITGANPYAFDFGFREALSVPFTCNLSILTSKKNEIYSEFGAVYIAQASLVWKVGKRLVFTGGAFLNKQFTPMNLYPVISYGYNSQVQFSLTKKIQLNIYGNYLDNNPGDPFTTMNSLFTQTKIGSNITFIRDESSKIGLGMDHNYNATTEAWEPVYGTKITYKFPNH